MQDKISRIQELTAILNAASAEYYQEDRQSMSDKEYDALLDELAVLENETGYSRENSPVSRVGHEVVSALEKVSHKSPMWSLDKTKDEEKMRGFIGGRTAVMSLKLDGVAIELTYDNGRLFQAVTRGNGLVGENVSHNARNFVNIPASIDFRGELRVRGEAVISYADFEIINSGLSEKYKNPRNLCSGIVRRLDNFALLRAKQYALRAASHAAGRPDADASPASPELATQTQKVHFFALSVADNTVPGKEFVKKSEILKFLGELGFDIVKHSVVSSETFIDTMKEFKAGLTLPSFATDGLVVSYDDIEYSRVLGHTSKFPRDSLAFKWADEEAETTLLGVEWSTSRTGLINPVAVFAPVEIEGTTVERASLHNVSMFEELAPGIGDKILVYKANMIIPQVSRNLTRGGSLAPPANCPVCAAETEVKSNKEAKTLCCQNPNCEARTVQTIAHYASRGAMNIEGLSEQTIIKLHSLGMLNHYADLYGLNEHRDALTKLKGFGEQSVNKLLLSIEKSARCNLYNFITGLGIDNVGRETARALCVYFGNDLGRIRAASEDELTVLHGFGEAIAKSLRAYFANPRNMEIMDAALPYLTFTDEEREQGTRPLDGKQFVITGELVNFPNRNALRELIEKEGGRVASSVSAKTDYLINNDAASSSSKNKKAKELGVAVITEEEFANMLNT